VLHARLYVNSLGRIFALRGSAAHDKLKYALARHDRPPTAANAPMPQDLGVPACDGELSRHHFVEIANRLEIETAMAAYCGRLAAQCGLELADQGAPESICGHFWYDDGECNWPAAARAAWAETGKATEAMTLSLC
jgi:hypothetical protein